MFFFVVYFEKIPTNRVLLLMKQNAMHYCWFLMFFISIAFYTICLLEIRNDRRSNIVHKTCCIFHLCICYSHVYIHEKLQITKIKTTVRNEKRVINNRVRYEIYRLHLNSILRKNQDHSHIDQSSDRDPFPANRNCRFR